jgi:predicted RNA-binding Zn ribbon-like protein
MEADESRQVIGGGFALGSVLAAMTELALTGAWNRFKACRNCHFAFYDRSRNTLRRLLQRACIRSFLCSRKGLWAR